MNKQLIATAVASSLIMFGAGASYANESHAELDKSVRNALEQCRKISSSCKSTTEDAAGILVFPNVVKADLIVGGAGGKGALIEDGKITGYYSLGAASAGLQAGVANSSQVYVFRSHEALNKLRDGMEWKVSANAGVTLIEADANASKVAGDVLAYVFNSKGLNAGVSLDVFDVWKSDHKRPSQS